MYSYKSLWMAIYSLITWTFIVCLFFNQSPMVMFLKLFPLFCFHKSDVMNISLMESFCIP